MWQLHTLDLQIEYRKHLLFAEKSLEIEGRVENGDNTDTCLL